MDNNRIRKLSGLERVDEAVTSRKLVQILQKLVNDAKPIAKMIKNVNFDNEGEIEDVRDLIGDLENVVDDIGNKFPNK